MVYGLNGGVKGHLPEPAAAASAAKYGSLHPHYSTVSGGAKLRGLVCPEPLPRVQLDPAQAIFVNFLQTRSRP